MHMGCVGPTCLGCVRSPACSPLKGSPDVPGRPTDRGVGGAPDCLPPALLGRTGTLIHTSVCEVCRTRESGGRRDIRDREVGLACQRRRCVYPQLHSARVLGSMYSLHKERDKLPLASMGAAFWSQPGLGGHPS